MNPSVDDLPDEHTAKAQILAMEHEQCSWQLAGRWELFDDFFTDDFTNVSPGGAIVTRPKDLDLSAFNTTVAELETHSVRVHGPVAVALGTMTLASTWYTGTFRFTDTFIWTGGKWKCLASHQTEIAP